MDNKDNNPHLGENTALPIDGWQKELDDLRNKELPQEVVNAIKGYSIGKEYAEKGAQIAHLHYLKELQAKDTTIKEQAEKIEKLTGLLKDEITKEYLNPDEEDRELLGLMIHDYENETERFLTPQQAADDKWNEYKEQHGI